MKAVKIEAPGGLDLGDFGTVPGDGVDGYARESVVRPVTWLHSADVLALAGAKQSPLDPRLGLCVEHIPLCQRLVVAVQS
jgi:hypothetical protein